MNKTTYYLFCLLFFQSCLYDPPLKGKSIYFLNQTDNYVLICDSLNDVGFSKLFDTILINDNIHIMAKGNYLPKYRLWEDFISINERNSLKKKNITKINYRFIREDKIGFSNMDILNQKLYDSIELDINDIFNNQLNYIIYYNDSIKFVHKYDVSFIKK